MLMAVARLLGAAAASFFLGNLLGMLSTLTRDSSRGRGGLKSPCSASVMRCWQGLFIAGD